MSTARHQQQPESARLPSSQGDSPRDMTPHDVAPGYASWKDRTERKTASENQEEKEEAQLDEAIELSFPASDPIALPACASERQADEPTDPETHKLDKAVKLTFPASDPIAPASVTRVESPARQKE